MERIQFPGFQFIYLEQILRMEHPTGAATVGRIISVIKTAIAFLRRWELTMDASSLSSIFFALQKIWPLASPELIENGVRHSACSV
jgi:hypothetical protein